MMRPIVICYFIYGITNPNDIQSHIVRAWRHQVLSYKLHRTIVLIQFWSIALNIIQSYWYYTLTYNYEITVLGSVMMLSLLSLTYNESECFLSYLFLFRIYPLNTSYIKYQLLSCTFLEFTCARKVFKNRQELGSWSQSMLGDCCRHTFNKCFVELPIIS